MNWPLLLAVLCCWYGSVHDMILQVALVTYVALYMVTSCCVSVLFNSIFICYLYQILFAMKHLCFITLILASQSYGHYEILLEGLLLLPLQPQFIPGIVVLLI